MVDGFPISSAEVVDFGRQLLAKEVRGMAAISPIIRKKQGDAVPVEHGSSMI